MEWTKKDTLKVIELWKLFPCLWDKTNSEYKNKEKSIAAITYMANQIGVSVLSVKKKLFSLKVQYNRELLKKKTKSETGADKTQSNWYASKYLNFLKYKVVMMPPQEQRHHMTDLCMPEYNQDNDDTATDNYMNNQEYSSSSNQRFEPSLYEQTDEFTIFGEAIASELRGISNKRDLIILKREIMELIYKTKLKELHSDGNDEDMSSSVPQEVQSSSDVDVILEVKEETV